MRVVGVWRTNRSGIVAGLEMGWGLGKENFGGYMVKGKRY